MGALLTPTYALHAFDRVPPDRPLPRPLLLLLRAFRGLRLAPKLKLGALAMVHVS
jgi:hypothetical protein